MAVSCGIGPTYSPALSVEGSGLNVQDRSVVVTRFYKAQTEHEVTLPIDMRRS